MDKPIQDHDSSSSVQFTQPTTKITFDAAFVVCEKLIYSIANKFSSKPELEAELIQEGYLGLYRAVELFDLRYNSKLSTFAYRYIEGYMLKYLTRLTQFKKDTSEFDEELFETDYPNIYDEIDLKLIKDRFCSLTLKQEQIMNLHFIQDLSVTEIADRLIISKQRVSKVIKDILKNIKKNLN